MSDLDKKMSEFLHATGADPKMVLRTRYIDDVVRLSREGYSDQQINDLLTERWIEESAQNVTSELNLDPKSSSRAAKWRSVGYTIGSYFKPIASGWLIWIFVLFTLSETELMYIAREDDWFAWIILPPLATICVVLWLRRFLLPKIRGRT